MRNAGNQIEVDKRVEMPAGRDRSITPDITVQLNDEDRVLIGVSVCTADLGTGYVTRTTGATKKIPRVTCTARI